MAETEGYVTPIQRQPVGRATWFVLAFLAFAAIVTLRVDGESASALGATAMMTGTIYGGYLFLSRSKDLPDTERHAWRLVGLGFITIGTGIGLFSFLYVTNSYSSAFGPPDILYLVGYAGCMGGVALLPHSNVNGFQKLRLWLDGVIGAVALSALMWVFLYSEVASALADSPTWERIVGSAYPILDITALVVIMIVTVRRSSYRYDPRLAFISLGMVAQAAADTTYLLDGVGRSFAEAEPIFALNILAIAGFLVAGATVDRRTDSREYADRPSTPIWAMALPYGTAIVMFVIVLFRGQWNSSSAADTTLFLASLLVGALVIARQSVAIRENRRFVESQRTDLVASISHELRTPLTSIVGFLELLDSKTVSDEDERSEMIDIVTQQATYLSQVVSDLVMLASDTSGAMELDIESIALDNMAWRSVNAASIDPGSVRVDVEPRVLAFVDIGRIQQAIASLLANAVRYGGDRVLLCGRSEAGGLTIEVHDDGPGVPRKYELLIWEKFERGPNRLNATVPGSGIGLAVTNAIAKAHGGTAGYRRSERLGGACFWIRLPGRVRGDTSSQPEDTVTPFKPSSEDDAQSA